MNDSLTMAISCRFNLGELYYIRSVDGGYLSQNSVLGNGRERFFLKRYRFTEAGRVEAAHAAKFHFSAAGVPVILPLSTVNDDTFFALDGHFYSLFPFVEGRNLTRGNLPDHALESIGQMLAKLHKIGRDVRLSQIQSTHRPFDPAPFFETAERILQIIDTKKPKDDFDQLAEETIRLKLSMAKQYPPTFYDLKLQHNYLIHGDFHDSNLFFDHADQVSHVYDWEKTEIKARENEIVRSILFMCFGNPDDYRSVFDEKNFAKAAVYLRAYHEQNPLSKEMLAEAIYERHLGEIYSLWVESEHYLKNNDRVDLFLASSLGNLTYFSENLSSFTKRVCGMLDSE